MSGEWVVKQEKVAVGSQAACPRLGRFRRPVDNGGSKEQEGTPLADPEPIIRIRRNMHVHSIIDSMATNVSNKKAANVYALIDLEQVCLKEPPVERFIQLSLRRQYATLHGVMGIVIVD
jgi:hypothetical protein